MTTGLIIQITSTFTCTPIEPSLRTTVSDLGIAEGVGFVPPGHMSEYMLAPTLDSEQILGSVVVVRVEDWLRQYLGASSESPADTLVRQELKRRIDEFLSHLAILALRGRPVWFLACPSTGWFSGQYKFAALCRTYTNLLSLRVSDLSQVKVLNWPASWSSDLDDPLTDQTEQIPFTPAGFDQLGKLMGSQLADDLARKDASAAPSSAGSPELAAFLAGLGVRVEIAPAEQRDRAHVDRILRTAASFSLAGENPTISETEIDAILNPENCIVVTVTDRLSDFGVSGVIVTRMADDALIVEALSLSCTVLGKQVEYAVLSALAEITAERHLSKIVFEYRPSGRNQPMLAFLKASTDVDASQRYVLNPGDAETRISKAAVAPGVWSMKLTAPRSAR